MTPRERQTIMIPDAPGCPLFMEASRATRGENRYTGY